MLPTFVIGLREGLEAALIIGIVAAFVMRQGRPDLLRRVWLGVGVAVSICLAFGIGLHIAAADLPQRQQESLETVIAFVAVAMVTYMVVWMKRHSRDLKGQLEAAAGSAVATGSGAALVAMAFLAVFREGFETSVFLVAAFNNAGSPVSAGTGAALGLAVAIALGYGIYRGGVRINLSKFFRATGLVLVLVAGGLVASGLHTAHEAGWLHVGQQRTFDLSWLVRPGSVQSSLLTGILGIQPQPVLIEVIGWLLFVVPLGLYVVWPPGRMAPHRVVLRVTTASVVTAAVIAGLVAFAPRQSDSEASVTGAASPGPAPPGKRTVAIRLTSTGCAAEHTSYHTGPLTFTVDNVDASAVTEFEVLSQGRILGEKENLAPGFSSSFSLDLQPGDYTLFCPGASTEKTPISITGTASSQTPATTRALLQAGARSYFLYVKAQVASLTRSVTPLVAAIKTGDLAAAQKAYSSARVPYERIEPVAESFPDLDPAIDARADDVDPTQLTGYHRIEFGLFVEESTSGLAPVADGLVADVERLKLRVDGLPGFQPAELANGAVGLLEEAAKSKITGEEERYSHVDLVDFNANIEGSRQAFAFLQDGLAKIDPTIVATIQRAFAAVQTLVDTHRAPSQPSGFKPYTSLGKAEITRLARALQAVTEPLSRVAGKVVKA